MMKLKPGRTSEFKVTWELWEFPGGPVNLHLPANAGNTGLIPGLEDSTCREATKPATTEPAHSCFLMREATAMRSPCAATGENPHAATKIWCSQK